MNVAQLTERLSGLAPGAPRDALGLEARELLRTLQNAEAMGTVDDTELERMLDSALYRLRNDAQAAALAAQYEMP